MYGVAPWSLSMDSGFLQRCKLSGKLRHHSHVVSRMMFGANMSNVKKRFTVGIGGWS